MNYQKILSDLDYLCRTYEDVNLVRDVINSVNENQLASKRWLVDECAECFEKFDRPKVFIAAGWFGLLGHLIVEKHPTAKVTSFDMEPICEDVGKFMYPEVNFESDFIESHDCSGYDILICTSCEHVEDEVINEWISNRDEGSIVILQSNNYFGVEDHVNCKSSIDHFASSYDIEVFKSCELKRDKYTRFMIVGL